MLTKEELTGTWNDIKGRIKKEWGDITDNELNQVEGNVDRLVGLVQKKTGMARTEIEKKLQSWSENSAGVMGSASQAVQGAARSAQEYAGQAREMASEQYDRAQDMVRQRPGESLVVAFGAGMLLGVVVGVMCRSK